MLWVYDHYKYSYSYSAGIDFGRLNLCLQTCQILTSKVDPRSVWVKFIYRWQDYVLQRQLKTTKRQQDAAVFIRVCTLNQLKHSLLFFKKFVNVDCLNYRQPILWFVLEI